MIKLGNLKEESVGLDIGTYSIKATSIEKKSGENTLTAYNLKRIPPGATDMKIGSLIQETLDEVDLHPEVVNLSISGPDVIVRFITLPRMSREQLQNALTFEAEKYIPFDISEVVLDFLILGDAPEAGQMRVLLAAAKREPIEAMVRMIEQLGMTVNVMDTDPFAMFNAFIESNPSLEDDKGSVFLDLGHSQTDILISVGKLPCFMREIQIGGKDINDVICRDLGVSPEKAEEYKRTPGKGHKELVSQATVSVLDDLIKEMQLSFGYFENRYNKGIGGIYCSGGMIYQEGVIDYLSEKLGVHVKEWSPVKDIKISRDLSREDIESIASQLAVSIGLALRG